MQPLAKRENIQPTVVVVVDQLQIGGSRLGQFEGLSFLESVEVNLNFFADQADEIDAKVVVQIASGHSANGGLGGEGVGRGMYGAALFLKIGRRVVFAGDDDVEHVVVVPVIRHQFECAGDLCGNAGGFADVFEIKAAEVAENF